MQVREEFLKDVLVRHAPDEAGRPPHRLPGLVVEVVQQLGTAGRE
jgi:hypothetical protein